MKKDLVCFQCGQEKMVEMSAWDQAGLYTAIGAIAIWIPIIGWIITPMCVLSVMWFLFWMCLRKHWTYTCQNKKCKFKKTYWERRPHIGKDTI